MKQESIIGWDRLAEKPKEREDVHITHDLTQQA
jgi:hypothetical protein